MKDDQDPEAPETPDGWPGTKGAATPNCSFAARRWDVRDLIVVWLGQAHLVHVDSRGESTLCGSSGFSLTPPDVCWAAQPVPEQCVACHRVAFDHGVLWRSSHDLLPARFVGSNKPDWKANGR